MVLHIEEFDEESTISNYYVLEVSVKEPWQGNSGMAPQSSREK